LSYDKNIYFYGGKMAPVAKDVDEYIAIQRGAIAQNPECGNSHYNLAVALIGLKKLDEAEEELHTAVDCSPTLAEAYVQLGGICMQRGDMEGALYYNKMAVKSRAGFAPGYANIGFLLLQEGDVDEAIKNLQKAIVYNSKFVQAFTTLGNAYLMKGLVDESIEANKKAIEIQPDFPVPYYNLGLGYLEKGNMEKAVENIEKAKSMGYEVPAEITEEIKGKK
jgi:tetratricopeptide (TPR) repeat protein